VEVENLIYKFYGRVDFNACSAGHTCWEWTGGRNREGYGVLSVGRDREYAHRFSYRIHKGEIPDGLIVMHSCDNPGCVNPLHLSAGTPKDNTHDSMKKGRLKIPTNLKHGLMSASASPEDRREYYRARYRRRHPTTKL